MTTPSSSIFWMRRQQGVTVRLTRSEMSLREIIASSWRSDRMLRSILSMHFTLLPLRGGPGEMLGKKREKQAEISGTLDIP